MDIDDPFALQLIEGVPQAVYTYEFSPQDAHPEDNRGFMVSLLTDNTLLWDDFMMRRKIVGSVIVLMDMVELRSGMKSEKDLPYLVRTSASLGVLTMIDRIKNIEEARLPLGDDVVLPLDAHLNEIFWEEVNMELIDPVRHQEE
jgi:hypothetical protein